MFIENDHNKVKSHPKNNRTEVGKKSITPRIAFEDLKNTEWLQEFDDGSFIGEDTPEKLMPLVVNIGQCMLDITHKFPVGDYGEFKIIEDSWVRYKEYGNASGSNFGTNLYRTIVIEDKNKNTQQINIGVSVTGKTINDPRYASSTGKSVLIVAIDNNEKSHTVLELNMNKFLGITGNEAIVCHSGAIAIGKFGSGKPSELKAMLLEKKPYLLNGEQIILGKIDTDKLLYVDTPCMVEMIINLIKYALIREEYRDIFKSRKMEEMLRT